MNKRFYTELYDFLLKNRLFLCRETEQTVGQTQQYEYVSLEDMYKKGGNNE